MTLLREEKTESIRESINLVKVLVEVPESVLVLLNNNDALIDTWKK